MSAIMWSLGFMVNVNDDFETRFNEVLTASPVNPLCNLEVQKGHDLAVSQLADYNIQKPYEVLINGSHDYFTGGSRYVAVDVHPTITEE